MQTAAEAWDAARRRLLYLQLGSATSHAGNTVNIPSPVGDSPNLPDFGDEDDDATGSSSGCGVFDCGIGERAADVAAGGGSGGVTERDGWPATVS